MPRHNKTHPQPRALQRRTLPAVINNEAQMPRQPIEARPAVQLIPTTLVERDSVRTIEGGKGL